MKAMRWWGIRHVRFVYLWAWFKWDTRRALAETEDVACIPWCDLEHAWRVRRGEA